MAPEAKSRIAFAKGIKASAEQSAQRSTGEFDGLLGSLKEAGSLILSDLVADIRDVVLDWCQDEKLARTLLAERSASAGYRNIHPVPADVELALRLLGSVASAMRCTPEKAAELFLGKRDSSRQAGNVRGGKRAGAIKATAAASRHADWIKSAKSKLAAGALPHDVTSIVANGFGVTAAAVRPVLQGAGLLPSRKKRK